MVLKKLVGWLIHVFTASGAFLGLLALYYINSHEVLTAFWCMAAAIVIDAVDGHFARIFHIKKTIPSVDGALLDNMVDFFNYSMVPAYFILVAFVLPLEWRVVCSALVILASSYQFTQVDAKTRDHFFKGFPSYWNIVVFYLFFWQMNVWVNMGIVLVLVVMSFIPIKYVYPSRVDYLTSNRFLQFGMVAITIIWGIATILLLWNFPQANPWLVFISMGYLGLYFLISLYRTWRPLRIDA
jgi:phosphatidylcholine synthase